jgi:NADPH:quinone reductase-like Zn-dependent oxidoreductase
VPAAVDVTAAALAPGQIGLRVQAVGLNFRDVLNVRRGVVRIDE